MTIEITVVVNFKSTFFICESKFFVSKYEFCVGFLPLPGVVTA